MAVVWRNLKLPADSREIENVEVSLDLVDLLLYFCELRAFNFEFLKPLLTTVVDCL